MADIKQAAKWLKEGYNVRIPGNGYVLIAPDRDDYVADAFGIFEIVCSDGGEHSLGCSDLLSEEWEITYEAN